MFKLSVRPDRTGFWYLLEVPRGRTFVLEFFAIGPGGQLVRDEISGRSTGSQGWLHYQTDFPISRVGVIHCEIYGDDLMDSPEPGWEDFATSRSEQGQITPSSLLGLFRTGNSGKRNRPPLSPDLFSYDRGIPYPREAPYPRGIPYPREAPYPRGIPYPREAPYPRGVSYPREAPYPRGIPYPREAPYPRGIIDSLRPAAASLTKLDQIRPRDRPGPANKSRKQKHRKR